MWRQFPSDANEAFSTTGRRVFSAIDLIKAQQFCIPHVYQGQLIAKAEKGKQALEDIRFEDTPNGELLIWDMPDKKRNIKDRYVIIADIGGKTEVADFSTIRVIDRYWLIEAGTPESVATWKGHLDQDLFAWVCAQVAHFYNEGLLIIESNSLRSEQIETEGDHFLTVLDEISKFYRNLFTRTHPEKIREGTPIQWGFHTNRQTKPLVINSLNGAFRDGTYIEKDKRVIDECDSFEYKTDGSMGAVEGAHDDLVIPTAIGVWASEKYMDFPRIIEPTVKKKITPKRTEASL